MTDFAFNFEFCVKLRIPQHLYFTIHTFYSLVEFSTNDSGFYKFCVGFRNLAHVRKELERYSVPKQQKRSNKSSKVAKSGIKVISAVEPAENSQNVQIGLVLFQNWLL